jgi:hypothetical protein
MIHATESKVRSYPVLGTSIAGSSVEGKRICTVGGPRPLPFCRPSASPPTDHCTGRVAPISASQVLDLPDNC